VVLGLLLFAIVFAVYCPSLGHDFTNYDDDVYVTANPNVQAGLSWAGVRWALTAVSATNWHPLTWLSHMLDCQVYGVRPWGHHFTNITLHALNAALLFFLLVGLTSARWPSFVAALLFGLHPAHVESVAWVSERKDVLSTAFFLLTVWAYAKYAAGSREQPGAPARKDTVNRGRWYATALGFYLLGLASKPMLVTLPFVLLLLDFWPLQRIRAKSLADSPQPPGATRWKLVGQLVVEKVPFFCLAAAVSIITFLVQRQEGAMVSLAQLPWDSRLQNAVVAYVRYLGLLAWPVNLAVFYPHPGTWPAVTVIACGLLLVGITAFALFHRWRWPWLVTGWLWFVGTLVPVIGIVQVGRQAIADRYTYIPFIGLFFAIAWGAATLARRLSIRPPAVFGLSAVLAGICAAGTVTQLSYWKNSYTLFSHAAAVTRDNYVANIHLGDYFLKTRNEPERAIVHYREAVRQRPEFPEARGFLASALFGQGRLEEALDHCREAVRLAPRDATAQYNYAVALERKGELKEAIDGFGRTLALSPDNLAAHREVGLALQKIGRQEEAVPHFRRVTELQPLNAEAHSNLGAALLAVGKNAAAIESLRRAVERNPNLAEAQSNLGIALCREGRLDEGIRHFEIAAGLNPSLPEAHNNLGVALARKGRREEAIAAFREALRLKPSYPEAQAQLQSLLNPAGK
jgi:tetratricopeptide (TPR) repeat protein